MSLFGVTKDDVLLKLVPSPGNAQVFSIGADKDMTEAQLDGIIAEQEAIVESYLRHKYQVLMRRVEGEVAVRRAFPGQTTCQASLTPVVEMKGIYKNFARGRAWPDRRFSEAMGADEYSVDLATGVVTFAVPLEENDRIFLDYTHGGASKLLDLKHLVLSLVAVEIARRCAYFRSADGFDRFEGWQISAAGHLRDLGRTEGAQIGLLDRIDLVNETRNLSLGDL